jgi:hypothetical protein
MDLTKASEYAARNVNKRFSAVERARLNSLLHRITDCFAHKDTPLVDPDEPLLPDALRILANSIDYARKHSEAPVPNASAWD